MGLHSVTQCYTYTMYTNTLIIRPLLWKTVTATDTPQCDVKNRMATLDKTTVVHPDSCMCLRANYGWVTRASEVIRANGIM